MLRRDPLHCRAHARIAAPEDDRVCASGARRMQASDDRNESAAAERGGTSCHISVSRSET